MPFGAPSTQSFQECSANGLEARNRPPLSRAGFVFVPEPRVFTLEGVIARFEAGILARAVKPALLSK